jgi:putative redox protein
MIKKARVDWIKGYLLEGHTDSGKTVMMDTGKGANDASPAELLLQALAGCTMMDCCLIVSKARKHLDKFWVDVEADEAQTQPKVYKKIHLTFNFISPDLDKETAERAIKLSKEKYCRIHAMLHGNVVISSSYNLNKNS